MNKNTVTDSELDAYIDADPNSLAGTGEQEFETKNEPVELRPVIMDKTYTEDDLMYDFRPRAMEADRPEASPKGWSAPAPVVSSSSKTVQVSEGQLELDLTVPAAKGSTKHKG